MINGFLKSTVLLLLTAVITPALIGACPATAGSGGKKASVSGATIKQVPGGVTIVSRNIDVSNNDISGQVRRLQEDLEDLDKKLARVEPDSTRAFNLRQKREKEGLKMIHLLQRELINYPSRRDQRWRKMQMMLHNEASYLQDTAVKIKDFPIPKRMAKFREAIKDIQSGKEKYIGKVAKKETVLLQDIQKRQRTMLEEYHKQEQRQRR